MADWSARIDNLPPGAKRAAKPIWKDAAITMSDFSVSIREKDVRFRQVDEAITKAFGRGLATMSDSDHATAEVFNKIALDIQLRQALTGKLLDLIIQTHDKIKGFVRGPSTWNKARRLGAESLKLHAHHLRMSSREAEGQLDLIENAKNYL